MTWKCTVHVGSQKLQQWALYREYTHLISNGRQHHEQECVKTLPYKCVASVLLDNITKQS